MNGVQHRENLNRLVDQHFDLALKRVDSVYQQHFYSASTIFKRHWRHKRDIPVDLASLPRGLWRLLSELTTRQKTVDSARKPVALSAKQIELQAIITETLLDLPGLENKLEHYISTYQHQFDVEFELTLHGLTQSQRQQLMQQLDDYLKQMSLPVEGAREALLFMLTGLLGKKLGVAGFASSIAVGQATASAIYISHAGWWAGFWASLTGVPGWVSVLGAGGGVLGILLIAPLLAPLMELGINRLQMKKKLYQLVEQARTQMIKPEKDTLDVLAQLAIYIQTLPDILHFLSKIKP